MPESQDLHHWCQMPEYVSVETADSMLTLMAERPAKNGKAKLAREKNHGGGISSERTGRCSILHTSSPDVLSVGQTHEEPEEHQRAPINIAESAVKKRGGQKV